jgi:hypothetical protein
LSISIEIFCKKGKSRPDWQAGIPVSDLIATDSARMTPGEAFCTLLYGKCGRISGKTYKVFEDIIGLSK